jgi:hypothetical protein
MSMKVVLRAVPALILAVAVAAPARAGEIVKERANVVSTNWPAMEIDLKDPKGRQATWKVQRDAVVVFSDKKEQFPNPKLTDLRPPMYVHFTFDGDTRVISRFEVMEVGFEPAQGGPGVRQDGVITNLDVNVGHVVVQLATGTNTFAVEPKDQLRNFRIGDKVSILIETRPSGQEIVTKIDRK